MQENNVSNILNKFGQPIGEPVKNFVPAKLPSFKELVGRHCRIEPLEKDRHAADLFAAYALAENSSDWTYLAVDKFDNQSKYVSWVQEITADPLQKHFAVIDLRTGKAVGSFALLRPDLLNGAVEVGWVVFSPLMQKTPLSTEAHFLLAEHVFEVLGFRRYEWKCDSLNIPSKRAAIRLGFSYEGTFKKHVVYKNRRRDTSWFAMTDDEWPVIKKVFLAWLDPANFDANGRQLTPLNTKHH